MPLIWGALKKKYFFTASLRLEMQADVAVHSLKMTVDPADSTYMPSLLVISGGDSVSSLKEITTVNVFRDHVN